MLVYVSLGRFGWQTDKYDEAAAAFAAAQEIATRDLPADDINNAYIAANVAISMLDQERWAEALTPGKKALAGYKAQADPSTMYTTRAHEMVGRAHRGLGEYEDALTNFQEAVRRMEELLGVDHAETEGTRELIAELCEENRYKPACEWVAAQKTRERPTASP